MTNTMPQTQTTRPSIPPEHTTHPPMSRSRLEGIVWCERLMSTASVCSSDAARFMVGLATEA